MQTFLLTKPLKKPSESPVSEKALLIPHPTALGVRGVEKVPLALVGNPMINKLERETTAVICKPICLQRRDG